MISVSYPKVKNERGERRADEESLAATTRAIRGWRNRIAGAFLLQRRDRRALSCRETLIIKVFVYCLANGKPAARGGGTYRTLATLHNYAVAPRFVFVMNAPLSSSESIIAGRFCPRACVPP